MTTLESKIVPLQKTAQEAFAFTSNFKNFGKLMPEQVINYESTENTCSFTIQGMASLSMQHEKLTPNSEIVIIPNGKVPFGFKLFVLFTETGTESSVQIKMDADLNPLFKMMAEKPLTNFLNLLAEKLPTVL